MSITTSTAIGLYARAKPGYADRVASAVAVLKAAVAAHPGRVVLTTSLGVEDMVLADLIARHDLPIALATLQTGRLHTETLALIPRLEQRYGLKVERWLPQAEQVVEFVRDHGELAMRQSIDLRKACCALRKLEPLARLLEGRSAWITGLRREQSDARADVSFASIDDNGRTKYSPLADWSQADVWHHVAANDVPYNPLHDAFFPSIGCAPCTRAVAMGEDFRAGRWWWENEDAKECGLHASTTGNPGNPGNPGEPEKEMTA
jgi:phosphoadenosine phosphosulfate reductase